MNWKNIRSEEHLEEAHQESFQHPVLIFKHSTRCSISATALDRLERKWASEQITPYYLDLLSFRPISQAIAEKYQIEHQSPQILLIKNGVCVYSASHYEIDALEIANAAA